MPLPPNLLNSTTRACLFHLLNSHVTTNHHVPPQRCSQKTLTAWSTTITPQTQEAQPQLTPQQQTNFALPFTKCDYDSNATIPIDRPVLWVSNTESNMAVSSEHDPDHYPSNTPTVPTSWINTLISFSPPSKHCPNVTASKVTNLDKCPLINVNQCCILSATNTPHMIHPFHHCPPHRFIVSLSSSHCTSQGWDGT